MAVDKRCADRFLFDEKLAKRLFSVSGKSRLKKQVSSDHPLDESDDCELTELIEDDYFDDPLEDDHDAAVLETINNQVYNSDLRDHSGEVNFHFDNCAFVRVVGKGGIMRTIRKSSLVWLLDNYVRKMSSDRTIRVMQCATYQDRQKKNCPGR